MANGKRQTTQIVLNYIREFVQKNGYGPLYSEIREACGLASSSHVRYCVLRLAEAGLVTYEYKSPRSIRPREE